MLSSSGSDLQTPRSHSELQPNAYSTASETSHRVWEPFKLSNGLALYKEEEDAEGFGGAYMVSIAVHSSPKKCFDTLMEVKGRGNSIWAFGAVERLGGTEDEGQTQKEE